MLCLYHNTPDRLSHVISLPPCSSPTASIVKFLLARVDPSIHASSPLPPPVQRQSNYYWLMPVGGSLDRGQHGACGAQLGMLCGIFGFFQGFFHLSHGTSGSCEKLGGSEYKIRPLTIVAALPSCHCHQLIRTTTNTQFGVLCLQTLVLKISDRQISVGSSGTPAARGSVRPSSSPTGSVCSFNIETFAMIPPHFFCSLTC